MERFWVNDALVDADRVGVRGGRRPREDLEPRHRTDRWQRLAAEAEGGDAGKIAIGEFRGGVALDGEREVGGGHADAVVDNPDQFAPASLDHDLDAGGAGVESVLDELLDGRRRAFDDLAGGDAIDEHGVELAHGHGRIRREQSRSYSSLTGGAPAANARANRNPIVDRTDS